MEKFELDHDQLKKLVLEIKAVKAFNYKQFRKLTEVLNCLVAKGSDDEEDDSIAIRLVREIMSLNFKQFKKLNYLINDIILTKEVNNAK